MLTLEDDHLFSYDEALLLMDDFVKIVNDSDVKPQFAAFTDRLVAYFNKINQHISTLNSAVKKANETLLAEKLLRKKAERERKNLEYLTDRTCSLLFKYQQRLVLIDEPEKKIDATNATSLECIMINDNDSVTFVSTGEHDYINRSFQEPISAISLEEPISATSLEELISVTLLEEPVSATDELCNSTSISFQCDKCGQSFAKKKRGRKLRKCPVCDVRKKTDRTNISSESKGGSLKKKKNQRPIEDIPINGETETPNVRCDTCGQYYSNKSTLARHIRTIHLGEKPITCTVCDKRFALKSQLKSHILTHGSEKRFKCSVCDIRFKYPTAKRRHERIVHGNDFQYECAHCSDRFSRKHHLVNHIRTRHFPESLQRFECAICNKSFASKYYLANHELVHTSHELIKCAFCDARFKLNGSKIRHERMVHKIGDSFKCAPCGKVYCTKQHLCRHLLKVHT